MTLPLFGDAAPPDWDAEQQLVGPYYRDQTPWKLRFWFAVVHNRKVRRYLVSAVADVRKLYVNREGNHPPLTRHRERINRLRYPPADLTPFPRAPLPLIKDIHRIAPTLLSDKDAVDLIRVLRFGILPEKN